MLPKHLHMIWPIGTSDQLFYEMQCSEMKTAIFVLQMCNEMEFFGALTQSKVKRAKGLSLKKKTTQ